MEEDKKIRVINSGTVVNSKPIPGIELSERLRKSLLGLKGKFISSDGKAVDYVKMRVSAEFSEYKRDAIDLQRIDLAKFNEVEKKVFFINGLMEQPKLPESVLKVQHFFKTTAYNIAGLVFTLDDIEHGILRCNRSHPATTKPQLQPNDPKLKYICKTLDPRIHFALVCGAKSCPAISVYSVENIDSALDKATKSFCSQEVVTKNEKDEIYISKLFQWYRNDFGETDVDVLKWILPYLSQSEHDRCSILIFKLEMVGSVTLKYSDYNWGINTS